jgi:hypothetical protein
MSVWDEATRRNSYTTAEIKRRQRHLQSRKDSLNPLPAQSEDFLHRKEELLLK